MVPHWVAPGVGRPAALARFPRLVLWWSASFAVSFHGPRGEGTASDGMGDGRFRTIHRLCSSSRGSATNARPWRGRAADRPRERYPGVVLCGWWIVSVTDS
jgi:hypothetical protein